MRKEDICIIGEEDEIKDTLHKSFIYINDEDDNNNIIVNNNPFSDFNYKTVEFVLFTTKRKAESHMYSS